MSDEDEVRVEPVVKDKEKKDRQSLLERQFVMKVKGDYTLYYDKNKPDKVAIREYKDCIVGVDKDNNVAIKAIVERIQEKGWTSIKMSGNKALQVALAAEAMDKGIIVEGYEKPKKKQPEKEAEKTPENEVEIEKTPEKEVEPTAEDNSDPKDEDTSKPVIEDSKDKPEEYESETHIIEPDESAQDRFKRDVSRAEERRETLQNVAHQRLNNPTLEQKGAREYAYDTLSRAEAIQQFPELTPVYDIVGKAHEYLEDNRNRFTDEQAQAFTQGARNSCFEQLNKGVDLQERLDKVRGQRASERDKETPEMGLEA